jgi:hypothetical protein
MTMNKRLDFEIKATEDNVIESLRILVDRIEKKKATQLEQELAKDLLCEVNDQVTACPIVKKEREKQEREDSAVGADDETTILPSVKVIGLLLFALLCIGCTSTANHRANHQGSINENQYLQEKHQNDAETMSHLKQQEKHLETTQEWLGKPDEEVPHDHAVQDEYNAGAEQENEAKGLVGHLWEGAKSNWPWLAAIGGIGGIAMRFLKNGKRYKRAFGKVVVGLERAKESADEDGLISRNTINEAITIVSGEDGKEVREDFKTLVEDVKFGLREIKKEISDAKSTAKKSSKKSRKKT